MGKMTNTSSEIKNKVAIRNDIPEPPQFKVIFLNDNVTTLEFVISLLANIFAYSAEQAMELAVKIHEEGNAVVAILPFELAEQKTFETTAAARNKGFPLVVKIEPVG